MAQLAVELLRTTARAFYSPEHTLVIDALLIHQTCSDTDLASVLGTTPKVLRKTCGRLREDGLLSVQTRAERRADGTGGYHQGGPQAGKERLQNRDWYYLNYHRAIDSVKYRMYRLTKHFESIGLPTTEKKRSFLSKVCGHVLDPVEEDERANENESMKRLNSQMERLLSLMQKIDATDVPENDFEMALSNMKPIARPDSHPGAKMEVVDLPNRNLQSTKGLEIKPEQIAVQVQDDETVKRESASAEAQAKREKQARQNELPEWITHSTIANGQITAVGAKEEHQRREREAHATVIKDDDTEEKKPVVADEDIMAAYWRDLELEKEAQKAQDRQDRQDEEDEDEDEDEDDDDEADEFEDVDVFNGGNTPAEVPNGSAMNSNSMSTPLNVDSSNATDDERETKRARVGEASSSGLANGHTEKAAVATPAASDVDEDEDELEFENV